LQQPPLRVLGIAGSLRTGSWNRKLLEAARRLAPAELSIEPVDLGEIPLYNADLDTPERRPSSVEGLKESIRNADALLIATPEYNYGVPGVLKNAIDWASRPAGESPLAGKPVGIMGASPGALGAVRAQEHLKLVLLGTLSQVFPHPGVVVGNVRAKFDASGELVDEATRRFIAAYLVDFAAWVRRVGPPR